MIDTIRLFIPFHELPDDFYDWSVPDRIRNIKVSLHDRGLSISGSLPKYLWSQNIDFPKPEDIYDAFEAWSEEIGIDVSKAKVTQLDIAGCIKVLFDTNIYFSYLGQARYYERFIYSGRSLYYSNQLRKIIIYDKLK